MELLSSSEPTLPLPHTQAQSQHMIQHRLYLCNCCSDIVQCSHSTSIDYDCFCIVTDRTVVALCLSPVALSCLRQQVNNKKVSQNHTFVLVLCAQKERKKEKIHILPSKHLGVWDRRFKCRITIKEQEDGHGEDPTLCPCLCLCVH